MNRNVCTCKIAGPFVRTWLIAARPTRKTSCTF